VASLRGNSEIVRLLLDKNTNVDIQTNEGTTALMIASANGHSEVVKLLLDKGASTSLKNKFGKTAVDVAANEEIKILLTNRIKKI
jgi:ankyrin repeat protein